MTVEVGQPAPDFSLSNQDGDVVSLAAYRGKQAVLVVFYPFAFSRICTNELTEVRDNLSTFQNDAVEVLAVSTDPRPTLKAWADDQGYTFPLLSDFWPHGATAESYGVFFSDAGMAMRGTFLVDKDGIVRFSETNGPGDARDQQGWKDAISALA